MLDLYQEQIFALNNKEFGDGCCSAKNDGALLEQHI